MRTKQEKAAVRGALSGKRLLLVWLAGLVAIVPKQSQGAALFDNLAVLNSTAGSDSSSLDESVRVAGDGAGHWVAVWESTYDLGGTIEADYDIFVSHSDDNAVTWSNTVALNSNAADTTSGAGKYDTHPQIATDGAGNWVAVWHGNEDVYGAAGLDYDIFVSRSTDNGTTWTVVAALNSNANTDLGDDIDPFIATDGAGHWITAWRSDENLGGTIETDRDIFYSISTDNGVNWSAPATLNTNAETDAGDDYRAHLATDGAGNWVAVWFSQENLDGSIETDNDIFVASSSDHGATWSDPAALNSGADSDSGSDNMPDIATDGAGHWVCVWASTENLGGTIDTDPDMFVSRSADNGATWSPMAVLNSNAATDGANEDKPDIATHPGGFWLAAWHSWADLTTGTAGTDQDILSCYSVDSGATWSTVAALNNNADSDSGSDRIPDVAVDSAGNWLAAWNSSQDLTGSIGTDMDILYSRKPAPPVGVIALVLNSPSGGESYMPGLTYPIEWISLGNPGPNVRINLFKGGPFHSQISTPTANDGAFDWTVPSGLAAGADYKVKVLSTTNPAYSDLSAAFSVLGGDAIQVTWPNGGESATPGSTFPIRWAWIGSPGANVKINLFRGGSFERRIIMITPNDGAYDWTVPSDLTAGIDYKVKVVSTTNAACADLSDKPFAIQNADAQVRLNHWARYD
jgi:hypothetical protein